MRADIEQVDAHPNRNQKYAESEALERLHDQFDFGVIFGLGDQQACDQRADDG